MSRPAYSRNTSPHGTAESGGGLVNTDHFSDAFDAEAAR